MRLTMLNIDDSFHRDGSLSDARYGSSSKISFIRVESNTSRRIQERGFHRKKRKKGKKFKKKSKKKEGYEGGKNLISARRINLCEKEFFSRMFTR